MEVTAVCGLVVTAVVARFAKSNADSSRIDLADLIKSGPRLKYGIYYRPRVKISVTSDLLRIVVFSGFDRLKDALFC